MVAIPLFTLRFIFLCSVSPQALSSVLERLVVEHNAEAQKLVLDPPVPVGRVLRDNLSDYCSTGARTLTAARLAFSW